MKDMSTESKVYGPVNLSKAALSMLATCSESEGAELSDVLEVINKSLDHLNKEMEEFDGFPIDKQGHQFLLEELFLLQREWGAEYPIDTLYELNDTGLKSHLRADELEIGHKFEIDGVSGGSGVPKQWRRMENPFGPNVVNGKIAARVVHAYDGSEGKTEHIDADQIVRPILQEISASDNNIAGHIRTPKEVSTARKEWEDHILKSAIADRIKKRLEEDRPGQQIIVYYSVDHDLDEVAVQGKVIFAHEQDEFYGGEDIKNYQSTVLENPTWIELCVHFNDMAHATGDFHHCFFEGIYIEKNRQDIPDLKADIGVAVYKFVTGS